MKILNSILCIGVILFLSCSEFDQNKNLSKILDNSGKWTFINTSDTIKDYGEIDFKIKKINIHTVKDGPSMGLINYRINKDSLFIRDLAFQIIQVKNTLILLKGNGYDFILHKILFKEEDLNKIGTNPFYLRRCYFMVHLGYMTMDEAAEYLSEITKPYDDLELEEEEIIINRK